MVVRSFLLCSILLMAAFVRSEDDDLSEFSEVTCGSVVKIQHIGTGHRLHSHDVKWGSGSAQQSVTANQAIDDHNSLWIIRGGHGEHCPQGTPVRDGMKIRLTHHSTRQNLHSHLHSSPLSRQQEVSCFGSGGNGDTGDDWVIESPEGGGLVRRGKRFRLMHVDTTRFLHSHSMRFNHQNCGGNCPILDQQEVTGFPDRNDENNWWRTAEGVYFPSFNTNR